MIDRRVSCCANRFTVLYGIRARQCTDRADRVQAPAGHEEGARHPAGREADNSFSGGQGLANVAGGRRRIDNGTRMKTCGCNLRGHVGFPTPVYDDMLDRGLAAALPAQAE